ncbi:hypothetical protein AgCh_002874 [Apium graveolens]
MTCFYGFPERTRRRELWSYIKEIAGLLDGFRNTVEDCELIELDLTGGNYTWEKSRGTKDWKEVINLYEDCAIDDRTKKYFEEKSKLDELLMHEEVYWKQIAKSFWLLDGDSNTKFFHVFATTRKRLNHVTKLKNEDGEMLKNHEEMCQVVKEYFQKLFYHDGREEEVIGSTIEEVITEEHNRELEADFTMEEFTEAISQMHPDKASGPDGLNPAFFQNFWKLLGKEVFQCCKRWMLDLSFPAEINNTNVVLIPKKENVETMKDLRPIALCNVLYKLVAKVLANRLRKLLPGIISENQSAFVPGRSITDNVLVAFELLHYMKQKKRGSEGEVALKLDVSKAYDRVDWGFLRNQMQRMGFSKKWMDWIMLCVTTVSYSINFNGAQIGPITPRRGLRQGDPLSPYLFLFCVEGLSRLIKDASARSKIHGCQITLQAPAITHLLFADDNFLFCRADIEEVKEIREVLQRYETSSGQAINFQKSGIFFSSNVRMDKQNEIKDLLGVRNDLSTGHYLGLPSLIGRSKKVVFNYLKERIWSKIKGWSAKCLSRAGKAVLIRSVAQTIPSYAISCFLIPKSLYQELERMMNSFWWGSGQDNKKGVKWLSWTNMCSSKCTGGLGFRDLHGFNLALLGKQYWHFIKNPDTLVARVFKSKYYPNSSLLDASRGGGASFIWSGLWQAKEAVKHGFGWVLGDGATIDVFSDAWLRGKEGYRVETVRAVEIEVVKACDLFSPGVKKWDTQKVNSLFLDCDAKAILATLIPINQVSDRITWTEDVDGKYSVKSGYRYWHTRNGVYCDDAHEQGWKKLWKIDVPHKIKILLWRICRNNVHVRNLLKGKGVRTTIMCHMCGVDVEHLLHVFLDCSYAKQCWGLLNAEFDSSLVESAPRWLLERLAMESQEVLVQTASILWDIWWARNKQVWEQKKLTPEITMQ